MLLCLFTYKNLVISQSKASETLRNATLFYIPENRDSERLALAMRQGYGTNIISLASPLAGEIVFEKLHTRKVISPTLLLSGKSEDSILSGFFPINQLIGQADQSQSPFVKGRIACIVVFCLTSLVLLFAKELANLSSVIVFAGLWGGNAIWLLSRV